MVNQVKKFIIEGFFNKGRSKFNFKKEINALKKEDAVEKIYSELGGQAKISRLKFNITKITEST